MISPSVTFTTIWNHLSKVQVDFCIIIYMYTKGTFYLHISQVQYYEGQTKGLPLSEVITEDPVWILPLFNKEWNNKQDMSF